MDSTDILPKRLRLSVIDVMDKFGNYDGGKSQYDELINITTNYETALASVEKSYYKWGLDKGKHFAQYFIWNRVKENENVSFSKSTYFVFLERLKKYSNILPKSEINYEEQRAKKISQINKSNNKNII
jgi:hypothetical protein